MEVKVGVQNAREIVLETQQSTDEIEAAVADAIGSKGSGLFALSDERGRRLVVPAEKLAYVEIGEPGARRVGFGAA